MRYFWVTLLSALIFPLTAGCQTPTPRSPASQTPAPVSESRDYELASIREDIRLLDRRIRELNLTMEEVQRENRELRRKVAELESLRDGNFATMSQVNAAVNEMNSRLQAGSVQQRREIINQVSQQVESLARQTQSAIDALAKSIETRSPPPSTPSFQFSDDFPREGVTYTVQRGDTLSQIARRFNSTVRDIQNANRIADPASLQAGQTLFIPQKPD